jgi:hypothetical protein
MNKEIKELLNLFGLETIEGILTDMKSDDFKPYEELTQYDIEYYLDLRKGALFIE